MLNDADDYWDQRLENWAMWSICGASGGSCISAAWGRIGSGGGRGEARDVILAGDAVDTDELVRALPNELQRAIVAWYLATGTIKEKAADIGCHPETLKARVAAGKVRLDELDHARRMRARRVAEARA